MKLPKECEEALKRAQLEGRITEYGRKPTPAVAKTVTPAPSTDFAALCVAHGLPAPIPEFVFAPPRKWRFDWAWPGHGKIALELEGGVHRIKDKFHRDVEKYNRAALNGWLLLRCVPKDAESGAVIPLIKEAMEKSRDR